MSEMIPTLETTEFFPFPPTATRPRIRIGNLGKTFTVRGRPGAKPRGDALPVTFTALYDVNLDVREGEFLVLVGPSGCGKSTLLDILAGLAEKSSGTVEIGGQPVLGPSLDCGFVFQSYALFPWRTTLGNIEFGLEGRKISSQERRRIARRYLELVHLSDFADHYPHELSGGMRQRVAIARSLAYDPAVLLMDEPFAALDAQTRETLQAELLRIWRETGKTIVFITHSIDEAVFLGQRVAVMTSCPGSIRAVIDIHLPQREDASEDVRSSAAFVEYRHRIWELLRTPAPGEGECQEVTI